MRRVTKSPEAAKGDGNEAWGMPHQQYERTPDGTINNCALACLGSEKDCLVCGGKCPEPGGPSKEQVALATGKRFPEAVRSTSIVDPRELIDLSPGDTLSYTCGKELFTPVKYNAVEIGPFTAIVTVREGESGSQAAQRAKRAVDALWQAEFDRRVPEHIRRAREGQRG